VRYRLLALDLDGTLLGPGDVIGARTLAAIAEARRRGVHVAVVTGRRFRSGRPLVEPLVDGGDFVFASSNGIVTRWACEGSRIFTGYLAPSDLGDLLAFLRDEEGGAPLVLADGFEAGVDFLYDREHEDPFWAGSFARLRPLFHRVERLPDDAPYPFIQIAMWSRPAPLDALAARFATRFGDRFTAHVVRNFKVGRAVFEAYPATSGKAHAVRRIAAHLGVAPSEICAIGDEVNDLEMLREAGLGIAMGDAQPAVLEAADVVTARHDEDGVGVAVERWVLGDLVPPPPLVP